MTLFSFQRISFLSVIAMSCTTLSGAAVASGIREAVIYEDNSGMAYPSGTTVTNEPVMTEDAPTPVTEKKATEPATANSGDTLISDAGSLSGGEWKAVTIAGQAGQFYTGQFVPGCNMGAKLSFAFDVPAAGNYLVAPVLTRACGGEGFGDCGESDKNNDVCIEVPSDSSGTITAPSKYFINGTPLEWQNYPTASAKRMDVSHQKFAATVTLPAGSQTIYIYGRSDKVAIQAVHLVPLAD